MFALAQMIGCKTYGIECFPNCIYKSLPVILNLLKPMTKPDALYNPKVAFVPMSMELMQDFGCDVMFGYFFDKAFPKLLIKHIAQMCCNSPSLKYFLSTKASKKKGCHKLFESYGFEKVHTIGGLSKVGSNEKNTAYIYHRMECACNN